MSPRWTLIVGPGTVPPNVHAWTTKPSATVMSFSIIGMSMSWTVPVMTAGAVASTSVYLGALGSGAGLLAVPAAAGAAVAAATAPSTITSPFMPAAA